MDFLWSRQSCEAGSLRLLALQHFCPARFSGLNGWARGPGSAIVLAQSRKAALYKTCRLAGARALRARIFIRNLATVAFLGFFGFPCRQRGFLVTGPRWVYTTRSYNCHQRVFPSGAPRIFPSRALKFQLVVLTPLRLFMATFIFWTTTFLRVLCFICMFFAFVKAIFDLYALYPQRKLVLFVFGHVKIFELTRR